MRLHRGRAPIERVRLATKDAAAAFSPNRIALSFLGSLAGRFAPPIPIYFDDSVCVHPSALPIHFSSATAAAATAMPPRSRKSRDSRQEKRPCPERQSDEGGACVRLDGGRGKCRAIAGGPSSRTRWRAIESVGTGDENGRQRRPIIRHLPDNQSRSLVRPLPGRRKGRGSCVGSSSSPSIGIRSFLCPLATVI